MTSDFGTHPFKVFFDCGDGESEGKYRMFLPDGSVIFNGENVPCAGRDENLNVDIDISPDDMPEKLYGHLTVKYIIGEDGNESVTGTELTFDGEPKKKDDDSEETESAQDDGASEDEKEQTFDFVVTSFGKEDGDGNQYDVLTSSISFGFGSGSGAEADEVSINKTNNKSSSGELQIFNFDNNNSDITDPDFTLSSLINKASPYSLRSDDFRLLARTKDGELKYLCLGMFDGDIPNYDNRSIDYANWDESGALGCGCYFELKNFGCRAVYQYSFVDVIQDEHYLCGRSIDVICRVSDDNEDNGVGKIQYLNIDKMISGGGSAETWKYGRFALEKTDYGYSLKDRYLYVGGLICPINGVTGLGNGVHAIVINQKDRSAGIYNYGTGGEATMVAESNNVEKYIIPLYTISNGVVVLDWRIGPSAIMGEIPIRG